MDNLAFPNKRYDVIYADPPWNCNARAFWRNETLQDYYPVMDTEDIADMPIETISKKDCFLYLWAVDNMLVDALDVCFAWGFEYKKSFIWDKRFIGLGVYNRGQHEQLLMCKKGSPKMPDYSDLESSFYSEKRTKHSKKPNHYRLLIDKYHRNMSKIELFARRNHSHDHTDWDFWGQEA